MKTFIIILIMLFSMGSLSYAQNKHMRQSESDRETLDNLEKIKLVEVLNVNEETMVKFFARRKDFREKFKDLNHQKDEKLDQLQNTIDDNKLDKNDPSYKKQIDDIVALDREILKTRADFYSSLSDILSYRQISKLIVFERNFFREIRKQIISDRKRKFQ